MGISYKIFDTVTHPTINGKWIDGRKVKTLMISKDNWGSPIERMCNWFTKYWRIFS